MMKKCRTLVVPLALAFGATTASISQAQETLVASCLVARYADAGGDQIDATAFEDSLADFLESEVRFFEGKFVRVRLARSPEEADRLFPRERPALLLAPPSFYLKHLLPENSASVVAEMPRWESAAERFYLVGQKEGPAVIEELRGQTVRARSCFSEPYLKRAVFPRDFQPGSTFQLERASNLKNEAFRMIDNAGGGFNAGEVGAAAALLLDTEMVRSFQRDELLWNQLKIIWQSAPLPSPLVVTVGSEWSAEARADLARQLRKMTPSGAGGAILDFLRCPGFQTLNRTRLKKIVAQYSLE